MTDVVSGVAGVGREQRRHRGYSRWETLSLGFSRRAVEARWRGGVVGGLDRLEVGGCCRFVRGDGVGLVFDFGWVWIEGVQLGLENEFICLLWAIVRRVQMLGMSIESIVGPCMEGGCCGWSDGPLGLVTVCNDGGLVG